MHKNKDFGFTLVFTYNIHFVTQNGSSTFSTEPASAKQVTTSLLTSPTPTLLFPWGGERPGLTGPRKVAGLRSAILSEIRDASAGPGAQLCCVTSSFPSEEGMQTEVAPGFILRTAHEIPHTFISSPSLLPLSNPFFI